VDDLEREQSVRSRPEGDDSPPSTRGRAIALFDLDKTLVRKHTARLYIQYEYSIGRASLTQLLKVWGWNLQYWVGAIDAEDVSMRALRWYAGRDVRTLREEAARWAKESVVPHISDIARRTVDEHRSRGDFVAIATAAPSFIAEPMMKEFGIEHVACSELEAVEGALSGQVIQPLCYGQGKVERVKQLLLRECGSDDLTGAVAYSDRSSCRASIPERCYLSIRRYTRGSDCHRWKPWHAALP
jgi:HAD superfamily hydrolase (TIGR01490 family)